MSEEILCDTCRYYNITPCCDRPICRQFEWEPHNFTPGQDLAKFLREHSEYCTNYEKIDEP